jgi:hypothetical protein
MNETAQSRHSIKPMLKHLRFRRFSTVQLLVALVVLLISAPFVEELEGSHPILSVLFSLVLLAAVFAVADRKRVSTYLTRARWRRFLDDAHIPLRSPWQTRCIHHISRRSIDRESEHFRRL